MLTEQRYEMILNLLEENKSVTVTQIKELRVYGTPGHYGTASGRKADKGFRWRSGAGG